MRVAKKSVKRAPNLQDLLCLTVFICIIYLPTILLRFRLPGLKSIYLLWEHHTKSLAESSYSLLRGSDFSLQISLPGVIPSATLSYIQIQNTTVPPLGVYDMAGCGVDLFINICLTTLGHVLGYGIQALE
jgi:uncharacterized membrane protein YqaE (UPF0057 family)